MKENIPCQDCGKDRWIDTSKFSEKRYLVRSPKCRICATKNPELRNRISKGWFQKGLVSWSKLNPHLMPTPWNKGVKGYMGANATSFKASDTKGEKNVNWKGGITPLNLKIRQSAEYKLWRSSVYLRDNFTCVFCGARGVKIHADHIKPFALFPELRFAIDNGRTLCVPCHKTTDTYGGKSKCQKS